MHRESPDRAETIGVVGLGNFGLPFARKLHFVGEFGNPSKVKMVCNPLVALTTPLPRRRCR